MTGKQDQEYLHTFFTKIFMFRDGEWSERGVGNLKVYCSSSGTYCLVHHRERSFIVSLHHAIPVTGKLDERDDIQNCYSWSALDNSDNDEEKSELRTFAVKFKREEDFTVFKALFCKYAAKNKETVEQKNKLEIDKKDEVEKTEEKDNEQKKEVKSEDEKKEQQAQST